MRSEILTDFDELLQAYEWVFNEEIGGNHLDTYRIAATLIDRGDLQEALIPTIVSCLEEQFKGPTVICRNGSVDSNDLCTIVGITYNTWKSFVNSCLKGGAKKDGVSFSKPEEFQTLRPKPIEGGSNYGGPFELKAVLDLRVHRDLSVVVVKETRTLTKHLFLPRSLKPLNNPDPFVPVLRAKIRALRSELTDT